jgi:prepilin-type N-terminal cleavage/methylation domain-containing protein
MPVARHQSEGGFTLIETMIAVFVFSIVATVFYQVLFSAAKGSDTSRDVVRVSEEARLGFMRMVRDTREGDGLIGPTSTSFKVETDFDANGVIDPNPIDPIGNYESLTFKFNESTTGDGTISVSNGVKTEVLMSGVDCIRVSGVCKDVFSFASSRLEYAGGDGIATAADLDSDPAIGNSNGILDGDEVDVVDTVTFELSVRVNDSKTNFNSTAQLRNLR